MLCCFYIIYMCYYIVRSVTVEKKGKRKKGSDESELLSQTQEQYSKTWIKTTFPSYRLTHIQSELADPSLNRPACGRSSLFLILFCDITSTEIRLWKTTRLIYRTEFLCIINRLSNLSDSLFVVLLPTVLLLCLSFSFFFPAIKYRVNHLSSFQVFIVDRISCSSLLIVLLIFNQLHISVFLPSCIRNAIFFPDLSLHLTAAAGPWRENPPLFIFLPFPSVKGFVGEYFLILKTEGAVCCTD